MLTEVVDKDYITIQVQKKLAEPALSVLKI